MIWGVFGKSVDKRWDCGGVWVRLGELGEFYGVEDFGE